jgi:hypothetical protein
MYIIVYFIDIPLTKQSLGGHDNQRNDIEHYDIQHNENKNIARIIMLSVIYAKCRK